MNGAAVFLAQLCYCGHTRAEHQSRPGGPSSRCRACADGHYFAKPEQHERRLREEAVRADPNHRHERTHTAYACPGFIPFLAEARAAFATPAPVREAEGIDVEYLRAIQIAATAMKDRLHRIRVERIDLEFAWEPEFLALSAALAAAPVREAEGIDMERAEAIAREYAALRDAPPEEREP